MELRPSFRDDGCVGNLLRPTVFNLDLKVIYQIFHHEEDTCGHSG